MYAGHYREAVPIAERAISVSDAVGARGREVEAMGALGASLALAGDCGRGLAVLRDALATAKALEEPVPIGMAYLGLASTLYDCDDLEEAVDVGLAGSAWARGMRVPGFSAMALEALVPLGRWREAEAILADVEPGGEEGTGGSWNGLFAGIIAVRAGRLAEAQALLRIRRDAAALVTDAAFAGNLAGGLIELALAEGRLADGRALVDESLGWLAAADDVRFRSRVLRLGVRVEAEIALVARARRDRESEEAARVLGVTRVERLRELLATFDDGTSPVFAEARGNRALAEAEVTRLLDRPDPAAWNSAAERFIEPRRPYELAMCRLRQAEALLAIRAPRADAAAALAEAQALARRSGPARSPTPSPGWRGWPGSSCRQRGSSMPRPRPVRERSRRPRMKPVRSRIRSASRRASARSSACSSQVRRTDGSPRRCSSARARPASTSPTSSASSA